MIINKYNLKIKKICKIIRNFKETIEYKNKKRRIIEINELIYNIKMWKNKNTLLKYQQELSNINYIINCIDNITKKFYHIKLLIQLSKETKDNSLLPDIKLEIDEINNQIKLINTYSILNKKHDICNCYLDIQSGSGGIDAQDWSNILLRMYLKWLDKKGFKTKIIQELHGDIAGIKSATVHVIGKYAFGWLRTETGIHRLIRKSPFNSGNRRHTSFSSAFIYPDIEDEIKIKINTSDLRIDVYRASGAGGQHVNRTESAVRITHLPTSIVTQCQNERSQHKNKEQALKQMKLKLYNLEIKKKNKKKQIIENNKSSIGWGNQIRSYILDDSRIKDLRTGIEIRDVQSVLDGNLDIFIEQSLKIGL